MKKGFTLAEVLITLGIIGVVAAITMPVLITSYQKHVTVNRLKQTYSMLEQAVKMSEIDNGSVTEWDYPVNTQQSHVDWINKYLAPYLKNVTVEATPNSGPSAKIRLANGTIITVWNGNTPYAQKVHAYIYFTEPDKTINGKSSFIFMIGTANDNNDDLRIVSLSKNGVYPYNYTNGYQNEDARKILTDAPTYGCNSANPKRALCTALIMYDGWKISRDYPW